MVKSDLGNKLSNLKPYISQSKRGGDRMKIKNTISIVIIAIILIFTACNNGGFDEMNEPEEFVKGFTVDNTRPLTNVLTKTYELLDLKSFFGQIPPNENLKYGAHDNKSSLDTNHVNEKFPIECIRKTEDICYYTVYKVNEGGYFYVFWSLFTDSVPEEGSELNNKEFNNAMVYFTAYLTSSSFKKASDFDTLQENISTAEDVAAIDPAFELNFLMSSKTVSYSLLEDGTIMETCYKWHSDIKSRNDLIVKSKEVTSKNNACSHLSYVLSKDLP